MKNAKLNLGLVALIAGFGLVVTQSAFTTLNTPNYGFDQSTGLWKPLSSLNEGPEPGQYQCYNSLNTCKVYASENPNTNPETIDMASRIQGDFIVNP